MVKDAFYKPASIIFSTLLLLFPTGNAIYPTYEFIGFFIPIILTFDPIAENSGPTA
jgi:hypothetical protein